MMSAASSLPTSLASEMIAKSVVVVVSIGAFCFKWPFDGSDKDPDTERKKATNSLAICSENKQCDALRQPWQMPAFNE